MFAVVEAGGRQYRVSPGEVVRMEKVKAEKGGTVSFEKVTLLSDDGGSVKIGQPYVSGATVNGKVVAQNRDRKVMVFRYKPKKRVRVLRGHRQPYSLIQIQDIKA